MMTGMTTNQLIADICEQAIADLVFPGCSVGYISEEATHTAAYGRLTYETASPMVATNTIYDVASVTKTIPTASLVLMLIERGELELDDPVVRWIPELQNEHRHSILVRHLLTYTVIFDVPGGMSALAHDHARDFLPHLFAAPLVAEPGAKYFYTNGPAILLGLVVERLTGEKLDALAGAMLFEPLGMKDSAFGPIIDAAERTRTAPSRMLDGAHIVGTVQDPSAAAMLSSGVVSGAAGLFSTTPDLLRYMEMVLRGGTTKSGQRLFANSTVERFSHNELASLGATAAYGWELDQALFMGDAPAGTFGKTGYTGCVVLANMQQGRALVLLSNRTYPDAAPDRSAINTVRRALANVIFAH